LASTERGATWQRTIIEAACVASICDTEKIMVRTVSGRRSLTKAATYRILIMCLDFATLYLITGTVHVAIGFMIISNIYTSIGYFAHERLWARIKWGIVET
jgi:uncharacterized membrane protein